MFDIKIPKRLGKCPLVDALLEVRFNSSLDKSVIFGLVYAQVKEAYPGRVVNLPLSQIPAQIRDNDPNLQFKPLYRLEGDNTILQIGTDVICLSSKIPYIGWDVLSEKALDIINKLFVAGVINRVLRLGHRYVNFFEGNIDDELNMVIKYVHSYNIVNNLIRTEIVDGDFISTLQYSNSAEYRPQLSAFVQKGCLIDIDTFKTYKDDYFQGNIKSEINAAHTSEKSLFYSLLKPEFIQKFDPVYE